MAIRDKMLNIIGSKEATSVASIAVEWVSTINPIAGIFLTSAKEIAGLADKVRIDAVIKGLSTELNQEKQINQLYGYVAKSEENAFYVANTLRNALLSNSPIACTIMGRILAKHVEDGTTYDWDDNIVFHALESATDQDIRMFARVIKKYLTEKNELRIPFKDMDSDMFFSLEWCVYNRILQGPSGGIAWSSFDDNDYDTSHSPTSAGHKLHCYIKSVRQVLDYGLNS